MRKQLPNYITLGNLLCGSVAVMAVASAGYNHSAVLLIFLAAFLDLFDGAAARALGVNGPMGRELDSLADVISFGLAPSAIAFSLLNDGQPFTECFSENPFSWLSFLLVFSAAWRLARFNIDESQSASFSGLPSPANGLFWASLAGWTIESGQEVAPALVYPAIGIFSFLMVAPVRMFSFKFSHRKWAGNEVRYLFLILAVPILAIPVVITGTWSVSVPLLLLLYVIFSLITHLKQIRHT